MSESTFLELSNKFFGFCQKKLSFLYEKSFILGSIDNIIFLFIVATLVCSTFFQSEQIGALAIAVVLLTIVKLFIKRGTALRITKGDGMLIIYFLLCLLSVVNSTLLQQSIHGFLKTVIYITFYFAAANYFYDNKGKIKYILGLIGVLCFIESIIAIFQNWHGVAAIAKWQDSHYVNPEDIISRAYGTLKPYNPNLLGGYLVAGMSYVAGIVAMFLVNKNWKRLIFAIAALMVCSLAVFVTGSRGAYLGLGAVIAGLIVLVTLIINTDFKTQERLKSIWHKVVAALCGAFVLLLIAVPKITKRILSIFILRGDSSTSFRMNVYNSSWHMFCDNWLFGIGAGNQTFREIYGLYMISGYDALSTYSVPLEIAVEAGIFALLAFVCFIVLFVIDGYKFLTNADNTNSLADKVIVCAAILTVLGVMMHGMFDTIYFRPQVQFVFWTMIAMASSVLNQKLIENKEV